MAGRGQGVVLFDDDNGNKAKVNSDGSIRISGDVNTTVNVGNVAIRDAVDANAKATVYESGAIRISGDVTLAGASTGDGAILDGVTNSIRATVRDYANAKPLAVVLTNASGDTYNASGGGVSSSVDVTSIAAGDNNIGNVDIVTAPPIVISSLPSVDVSGDVTVSATNLDIRDLSSASDSVTVTSITNALPAGSNNIGDVDVLTLPSVTIGNVNAPIGVSGDVSVKPKTGEVFPVSDNSGSLTIDGTVSIGNVPNVIIQSLPSIDVSGDVTVLATNLDIRDLSTTDIITIGKVTAPIGISGDISTIPKAGQAWPVTDNNGSITVDGTVAISSLPSVDVSGDVTVSGSVTANAGTNLNTSALALETTATSIKTAVEIIDNAIAGTEMQVDVVTMPTTTVQATDLDVRDLTVNDKITIGRVTAPIGISGDVNIVPAAGAAANVPLSVRLSDGSDFYNAANTPTSIQRVSGDIVLVDGTNQSLRVVVDATGALKTTASIDTTAPLFIGRITAPIGVSGDVSTIPKSGQVWPVSDNDGSLTIDGAVSISSLPSISIAKIYDSIDVSGDVTVSGSVTANAGTNLNTSSLALESGGNLATIAGDTTSLDNKITTCNTSSVIVSSLPSIDVSGDVTVSATNLDIRDLSSVTDSVTATIASITSGDNVIGRVYNQGSAHNIFNVSQDFTVMQDNTLLYQPAVGKRVRLKGVIFTSSFSLDVYLHDGQRKITPNVHLATFSGATFGDTEGFYQSPSGDVGIYFSSNASGDHGVTIWGYDF